MVLQITPATAAGPYNTEAEAAVEPMPQQVTETFALGGIRAGDPDGILRNIRYAGMVNACIGAGVELGKYDARMLAWLSRAEPELCQVLIGLVARAYAAGLEAGGE